MIDAFDFIQRYRIIFSEIINPLFHIGGWGLGANGSLITKVFFLL
jgi:hypothetical protein